VELVRREEVLSWLARLLALEVEAATSPLANQRCSSVALVNLASTPVMLCRAPACGDETRDGLLIPPEPSAAHEGTAHDRQEQACQELSRAGISTTKQTPESRHKHADTDQHANGQETSNLICRVHSSPHVEKLRLACIRPRTTGRFAVAG